MHRPRTVVLSTRGFPLGRPAGRRRGGEAKTVRTRRRLCHAPAMAVTSKDIARKLKISQSTVSRALRGDPRVAPETTARILEAARQMNYTPNLAARSLITRKTGTVGLIVSRHHEPVLPRAARHPAQRVRARRLSNGPVQRADRRAARAARRRPRQRRGGRRARLRVGDARHAAPGTRRAAPSPSCS